MLKHIKKIVFLYILIHMLGSNATSLLTPRSQSTNTARQITVWTDPLWGINRAPGTNWYLVFKSSLSYSQTFKSPDIAQALFGNSLYDDCECPELHITGSAVDNRGEKDFLADYFGLPRTYQSKLSLSPKITNTQLDLNAYIGLDHMLPGLYGFASIPLVYTKWYLNAQECIAPLQELNANYPPGYFSPSETPYEDLNPSFLAYAKGVAPSLPDNVIFTPLGCSLLQSGCSCDPLTKIGVGDLDVAVGWNFIDQKHGNYHVGVGAFIAIPTGSRPGGGNDGIFSMEPIIGNGKHWELGCQISTHVKCWQSGDETSYIMLYALTNISHLFNARQTRCFDLCGKPNSRYMLAQRLRSSTDITPHLTGDSNAGFSYANEVVPVANLTEVEVRVNARAQGDFSCMLAYCYHNFTLSLGYNFWGKTCDRITFNDEDCSIILPPHVWALKGDNFVVGFEQNAGSPDFTKPVRLAATDSDATVHQGSNLANNTFTPNFQNASADSPVLATTASGKVVNFENNQMYSSEDPIFITNNLFDLRGTHGRSNKAFGTVSYTWPLMETAWQPFIGLGWEVEVGSADTSTSTPSLCQRMITCKPEDSKNENCSTKCVVRREMADACCSMYSLSQWRIWIDLGVAYR